MSLTPKQEAYCHKVADGLKPLDAVKAVGYNPEHASRQVNRLEKNTAVQNRIVELKAIKHIQAKDKDKPSSDALPKRVAEKVKALDFLCETYNDATQPMKVRVQAAVAALPYEEAKVAPKGKKEDAKDTAKQATQSGKFATLSNQRDLFTSNVKQ